MSRAALFHGADVPQGDEHRSFGVDVNGADDILVGLSVEGVVIGDDSRIVDEDVYLAAGVPGSLEGGIDGNRIGDIRPESVHLPEGRELLYSGLNGRFVDIPDDQLAGSFFQAQAAHDFANPGASSGNQHGFSLYLHGAKVVTFFAKK